MKRILRELGKVKWQSWVLLGLVMAVPLVLSGTDWMSKGYSWKHWTGLSGKTIWDVLELLIIPATLAIVAAELDRLEREVDRKIAKKRAETDREIALSNQQETALQNFFNFMADLMLKENLRISDAEDEIRDIARVKTITTLKGLDKDRQRKLIDFLSEVELITDKLMVGGSYPIMNLSEFDLKGVDLKGVFLRGVVLDGANLSKIDLIETDLMRAKLEGANLEGAKLSGANLSGANLKNAKLKRADLSSTNLSGARLERADLTGANLESANLLHAHLEEVVFDGAIMPDGKEYDPGVHTVEALVMGERGEV